MLGERDSRRERQGERKIEREREREKKKREREREREREKERERERQLERKRERERAVLSVPHRKRLKLRFLHFFEGSVPPCFFFERKTQSDEQNRKSHICNSTPLPVRLSLALSRGWGLAVFVGGPTCRLASPPSPIMPWGLFISCLALAWSHTTAGGKQLICVVKLKVGPRCGGLCVKSWSKL